MSFNTSLSGLNAAQSDLGVISNNIANASTVGFKESRAQFADIYAVSALGSGSTAIGSGVLLDKVAQQFKQGNLDFTDNTLDLAVSGQGFFVTTPTIDSLNTQYTRAGMFGVNSDGYVVNSGGQFLRVFPTNEDGTVTSTSLSSTVPLRLPASAGTPTATTEVEVGVNLPAAASGLDPALFDPTDANTYTASTSLTVYDSLGNSHIATTYFIKDAATPNTWSVQIAVDGAIAGPGGTLEFNSSGLLTASTPDPITTGAVVLTNGADDLNLAFDFAGNNPVQHASAFSVTTLSQNGYTTGRLDGLDISETGIVRANYTNGQSVALGKVALVDFQNPQGLRQLGNTSWADSIDSGEPLAGEGGTGRFGLIQSGAVESSNVDLTKELVNLITAQRNYQANAKAIETANTVTQTIINMR